MLYSPGYGAGWSTCGSLEDRATLLFHPELVAMVEAGKADQIDEEFMIRLGIENFYCGGADKLKIKWIPVGTLFLIEEHDGYESVRCGLDDMIIA